MSKVYVPIFTDVLDKTAEAAVGLIKFLFEELNKLEWFAPVFERIKKVQFFADAGRHFKSEVFLHYVLIGFVKENQKWVVLQFFVGGHGKTGQIDGTIFGGSGLQKALQDLLKLERLRTTEQLVNFFRQWRAKKEINWTEKQKQLTHWVVLHWQPTSFPRSCPRVVQKYLQKYSVGNQS